MTLMAELRIEPIGGDSSMREEVERAVEGLRREGLRFEVGPMGTSIQAESLDDVLEGVKAAHQAALQACPRIVTELVVDERTDKDEARLD